MKGLSGVENLPAIGQRIKVRIVEPEQPWYSSRVEDYDDEKITISAPFDKGAVVPFRLGALIQVGYEQPDAFYSFTSKVLARRVLRTNDLRLYDLSLPTAVARFQRREMFRLPMIFPVEFSVLAVPEHRDRFDPAEVHQGLALDVSGGGIKLAANLSLPLGAFLELSLQHEIFGDQKVKGKVVNLHELQSEDRADYKYHYGLKFVDLEPRVQDKIVSAIFAEQRRRRQRELGDT